VIEPLGVRILGIETSTRRGTVALAERGQPIVALSHDEPGAHAERMVGLVRAALRQADWSPKSLDRLGVGVGPGSFTGIRVGIALAHGIALGLDLPLVGVASLRAMARAVPPSNPGVRCPLVDARRGEVFAAAYESDGATALSPIAIPRGEALGRLAELCPGLCILVGEVVVELGGRPGYEDPGADLPHATWVAVLAGESAAQDGPVVPLYVRDVDAARPDLAPNPLASAVVGDKV
jgi:tRNA threonylcarbamoyladenosine biosynthesis protein TsaB